MQLWICRVVGLGRKEVVRGSIIFTNQHLTQFSITVVLNHVCLVLVLDEDFRILSQILAFRVFFGFLGFLTCFLSLNLILNVVLMVFFLIVIHLTLGKVPKRLNVKILILLGVPT